MIDFPYTVDDEPTEDWKVEQVMHWWLLRSNAESEAEHDRIVEGLSQQLEDGKKELWEAHKEVSQIVGDNQIVDNYNTNENENIENLDQNSRSNQLPPVDIEKNNGKRRISDKPEVKPVTAVAVAVPVASSRPTRNRKPPSTETGETTKTAPVSSTEDKKPDTIHIDIVGGPYEGGFYDLQPKSRSHAWLGRSSSAKFKDRGISLPQDLEVSTSHGRFELKAGKFYYTDVASTNGTRINGEECEANVPYELAETGTTIVAGQTVMKVTLLKLA